MMLPRALLWLMLTSICVLGAVQADFDDLPDQDDKELARLKAEESKTLSAEEGPQIENTTAYQTDNMRNGDSTESTAKNVIEDTVLIFYRDELNRLIDLIFELKCNNTLDELKVNVNSTFVQIERYLNTGDNITFRKLPINSELKCAKKQTTTTTTTTSTPKPTTTTSTTPKPTANQNRLCGLNNTMKCVKLLNCQNTTTNEENKLLIDLSQSCGPCHYLETCCSKDYVVKAPQLSQLPDDPRWGLADPKGFYVTLKGNEHGESNLGEFPWTVAVLSQIDNKYLVSGSLVGEQVVITTYYRLEKNETLKVRAGDWDIMTENHILPYQERIVNNKIHHGNYSKYTYANNIAILILNEPFIMTLHIKPILLARSENLDYNNCIVAGWYKNKRIECADGSYHSRLILTSMKLSTTECTRRYYSHESLMCVIGSKNYMQYSYGSALVCPIFDGNPNLYYQIGLWSHGYGNDKMFVNFTKLVDWIKYKIEINLKKVSSRL